VKVVFLGTGTSHGVPEIGCTCAVCTSSDARDRRLRASILMTFDDGMVVLVDTTPDLRQQALTHAVRRVDAILFTHSHSDHIAGLDDVRRFNAMSGSAMPIYGDRATLDDLRRIFSYAFDRHTPTGGGLPELRLSTIGGPFCLGRQEVVPVPIMHGRREILGFRVGRFAYLTDCSRIPDASVSLLQGLDVLVLDAVRWRPHPTHFTVDEAMDAATSLGAGRTYFTHIAHDLGHAATCASLPAGFTLAYDGLSIEVAS
jgi:phosphoribosyl 1,2-cyclic phosphate phosphodiesterase